MEYEDNRATNYLCLLGIWAAILVAHGVGLSRLASKGGVLRTSAESAEKLRVIEERSLASGTKEETKTKGGQLRTHVMSFVLIDLGFV